MKTKLFHENSKILTSLTYLKQLATPLNFYPKNQNQKKEVSKSAQ